MLKKIKGQSTLEFTLVIIVVVAALIAIQIYMKRGVEGKLRSSTDSVGEQFEAGKTQINVTTDNPSKVVQEYGYDEKGAKVAGTTTVSTESSSQNVSGSETVDKW